MTVPNITFIPAVSYEGIKEKVKHVVEKVKEDTGIEWMFLPNTVGDAMGDNCSKNQMLAVLKILESAAIEPKRISIAAFDESINPEKGDPSIGSIDNKPNYNSLKKWIERIAVNQSE